MAGVLAADVDAGLTSGTSGGDHQIIDANDLMRNLSEDIKQSLKHLDDALKETTAVAEEQTNKPTIPRAPRRLRLQPRVVSVGPYHHSGSGGQKLAEPKIKLAAMFIKEHEVNKEHLYCAIAEEIEGLRNCYEVDATRAYSDDALAGMFLIDGCVVLHFIYVMKYGYNIKSRKYEGLETLLAVAERFEFQKELMFLENQLPYRLLQLIICSSKESDREKLEESIRGFILSLKWDDQPVENQFTKKNQENALHLLDLFWKTVTRVRAKEKSVFACIERSFKVIGKPVDILMNFIILEFLDKIPRLRRTFNLPDLRSIQDLKEAGVELKLNPGGSLTDVKFRHGTLLLPPIVVNDYHQILCKFRNLMAYEISRPNTLHNYEVCSYIVFLASLIDRPEDVKELRVRGILHNQLDSDKQVVEVFKKLRIDGKVDFVYRYPEILEEIRKHYNKRRYRAWMVQFKTRYFESPWSIIALFGATMILVLTSLQTYYTVLSYYKS